MPKNPEKEMVRERFEHPETGEVIITMVRKRTPRESFRLQELAALLDRPKHFLCDRVINGRHEKLLIEAQCGPDAASIADVIHGSRQVKPVGRR